MNKSTVSLAIAGLALLADGCADYRYDQGYYGGGHGYNQGYGNNYGGYSGYTAYPDSYFTYSTDPYSINTLSRLDQERAYHEQWLRQRQAELFELRQRQRMDLEARFRHEREERWAELGRRHAGEHEFRALEEQIQRRKGEEEGRLRQHEDQQDQRFNEERQRVGQQLQQRRQQLEGGGDHQHNTRPDSPPAHDSTGGAYQSNWPTTQSQEPPSHNRFPIQPREGSASQMPPATFTDPPPHARPVTAQPMPGFPSPPAEPPPPPERSAPPVIHQRHESPPAQTINEPPARPTPARPQPFSPMPTTAVPPVIGTPPTAPVRQEIQPHQAAPVMRQPDVPPTRLSPPPSAPVMHAPPPASKSSDKEREGH